MTNRATATITLMTVMLMDLMDSTITNVALSAINTGLGATPTQLEWTLVGYVVALATPLITGGRLGDIYGRKRIFFVGVIGFTCALVFVSLAWSGNALTAARTIQGAFAGVMVLQVLSSVQVMYAPEERGPVFGITDSLNALGVVTGPLLGGQLATANLFGTGWRSIFFINVPVGIVLTVMVFLCTPESRSEHPLRLDFIGSVLSATAVVLLVLPLAGGRVAEWAWWIWAPLVAVPFAIITFIWRQHHRVAEVGAQFLPLPLFRIRPFSSGLLVQILTSIGHGDFALILLFHMQVAFHFTSLVAGLTLLPVAIGSIPGAPVAMLLMKKIGKWSMYLGGIMQAAAFVWVVIILEHTGTTLNGWSLLPPFVLTGVGMMALITPQTPITLAEIPTTEAGVASGTPTTFSQVGMVLGTALPGTAYFGTTGDSGQNVTMGLWVIVTAYTVSGLAVLTMPTHNSQEQPSPDSDEPG